MFRKSAFLWGSREGSLVFLTAPGFTYTLAGLLGESGMPVFGLSDFDRIALARRFRASAVIFCDIERMSPDQESQFADIARGWERGAEAPTVLNRPPRPMRRYRLLRTLKRDGVNRTDVFRLDDPETIDRVGFPCFIRKENGHEIDPQTSVIIRNRDQLRSAVAAITARGEPLYGKIVVEFEDVRDARGYFIKYSYMRVGEDFFPVHRIAALNWIAKYSEAALLDADPSIAEAEQAFIDEAPWKDEIARIYNVAGVDYGRIDFGLRADGKPHIFEINTNPNLPPASSVHPARRPAVIGVRKRLFEAFANLAQSRPPALLDWPGVSLARQATIALTRR